MYLHFGIIFFIQKFQVMWRDQYIYIINTNVFIYASCTIVFSSLVVLDVVDDSHLTNAAHFTPRIFKFELLDLSQAPFNCLSGKLSSVRFGQCMIGRKVFLIASVKFRKYRFLYCLIVMLNNHDFNIVQWFMRERHCYLKFSEILDFVPEKSLTEHRYLSNVARISMPGIPNTGGRPLHASSAILMTVGLGLLCCCKQAAARADSTTFCKLSRIHSAQLSSALQTDIVD